MSGGNREAFGTRVGFILAAVGGAVGLGNMWRFSATAAHSGGAAFVLLYLGLTLVVGIPLLLAELTIGRRMRLSPIGALRGAAGPRWVPVGYLFVLAGLTIFSYYTVIAGWAVRFGIEILVFGLPTDPATRFGEMASGPGAAGFHVLFVLATVMVVSAGVRKGIERAALLLIPLLFLILIGLAIWASGLDGASPGYAYYLAPAWSDLLDPGVVANAAGQTYFSMSLGMGASLTFASYMRDDANLVKEGTIIAFSDFSVAFLAGLVVFPVVFALGFSDQVIGLGASEAEGVLFIALPGAFATMGSAGRGLGLVFFSALSVAALTSTISLLEVVVSSVMDEWRVPRRTAALGAGGLVVLLGLAPSFSLSVLSLMNTVAGEIALALGAFLTVIAVGWFVQNPDEELRKGGNATTRWLTPGWLAVVRYVLPIVTGAVLVFMIGEIVVGG